MRKSGWIVFTLVFCFICAALVRAEDETKIRGLVTRRNADLMIVQLDDGTNQPVVLTDDTKVQSPKGLIGMRHKQQAWTTLLPGLAVNVKGVKDAQGQLVAKVVEFSKESLQMASMIQAGLQPTKDDVAIAQSDIASNRENISSNQKNVSSNSQNIAANQEAIEKIEKNATESTKRFDSLADYEQKGQMNVLFKPGSSTLSETDKATLKEKAQKVLPLKGYLIEIKGYADSTGNAVMNQSLSKDRAEAVISYLMQECNIPARHLLAPGAMGISNPTASNESASGRQENRRAEIVLMVNKATEPPTSAQQ
jgi:OOP family OmpA-OmpF porin